MPIGTLSLSMNFAYRMYVSGMFPGNWESCLRPLSTYDDVGLSIAVEECVVKIASSLTPETLVK